MKEIDIPKVRIILSKRYLLVVAIFIIMIGAILGGCNRNDSEHESTAVEPAVLNKHEKEWRLDLLHLKEELPVLEAGFDSFIAKEEWNKKIDSLILEIQNTVMTDEAIALRVTSVIAGLQNAHTNFISGYSFQYNFFPFVPWISEDGTYYLSVTSAEYEEYIGSEIVSFNGIAVDEVTERLRDIIPSENTLQIEAKYAKQTYIKNYLDYLGITDDNPTSVTFKLKDGTIETITVEAVTLETGIEWVSIMDDWTPTPISASMPTGAYNDFWYTLDAKNRIFYFQYNACLDASTEANPKLAYFSDFADEMFVFMKAHQEEFDKIVIDVRNNGGGNSGLFYNNIIRKYGDFLKTKEIAALIGSATFSAGLDVVNDLYRLGDVTTYGSETGGIIGGYTCMETLELKNTGSIVYYATKTPGYDYLLKRQVDDGRGIIPDVKVYTSYEEYLVGIDAVYERVISGE